MDKNCKIENLESLINIFKNENLDLSKMLGKSKGWIEQLAKGIRSSDLELLDYISDKRERAFEVLSLLKSCQQNEAAMVLLSNLSLDSTEEIDIIFKDILGLNNKDAHLWMLDYNIVLQRLEMINSVVVPYMREHYPKKELFTNLKQYEAIVLKRGGSKFSASEIREVLNSNATKNLNNVSDAGSKFSSHNTANNQFVMPNKLFNTILRMAWVSEQLLFDLFKKYDDNEVLSQVLKLDNIVPTYLVVTDLGYPMGGGESFMHQTCRIMSEFGINCVWASYYDSNAEMHVERTRTRTPYYLDIRLPGGRNKSSIEDIVKEVNPDLLHAQGGTNVDAMEIAEKYRISSLIGYHFWHGLIELGETGNQHIIDNIDLHHLQEPVILQTDHIQKYVASEFMLDVYQKLGGQEKLNVVHALSDNAQFSTVQEDIGKYVLQINVSEKKGGIIFLDCASELGASIPFMGVKSENDNTDIFKRIEEEINLHPDCVLKNYGNVRDFYKTARMVLVPTLVDETFCRVAFEAAMNGIPVLTTSNGYIPQLLGSSGLYLSEESEDWIKEIRELYTDLDRLREIGNAQRAHVQKVFSSDFRSFNNIALELIDNSIKRNIGIFTVWGDMGLGNLCHTYTQQLRKAGYNVHIFSFQAYNEAGKSLFNQKYSDNWDVPRNADSVYYSFNSREEVTVHELTQFLLTNKIDTFLIPEVCWSPNWERLLALDIPGLKTCVVPMIEIALLEEVQNHGKVTKVLHCTRLSERIMEEHGIYNGGYIGHGYGKTKSNEYIRAKQENLLSNDTINFLHVGGHNPVTRKNTPKVIDAFKSALKMNPKLRLTVTSMVPLADFYHDYIPEQITIMDTTISKEEVTKLYEQHDVSIQVSSHEGLGLGFFESIASGTPVITMNCPPHNEVIIKGASGWLIPCEQIPVPDNSQSLVFAHKFQSQDLARLIGSLDPQSVSEMILQTHLTYGEKFDELSLLQRLINALPQNSIGQNVLTQATTVQKENRQIALKEPDQSNFGKLRSKFFNKLERMAYQIIRPVSRGFVARLRNIVRDEISSVRHDITREQEASTKVIRKMILSTKRDLMHELQGSSVKLMGRADSDLGVIRDQIGLINRRLTSYAGKNTVLTYLRDGSAIYVNVADEGSPLGLVNNAVWEPENTEILYSFLKPDSIFVDVGANVGYFSISMASRIGDNGRIVAIEPHPRLQTLMRHSIIANSLENKIELLGIAALDEEASIDLYYPEDHLGKGSADLNDAGHCEVINVQSRRLDDIFNNEELIDLVKIDVEGHELSVLKGMQKILHRSPEIKILFDKRDESYENSTEIYKILHENGLQVFGVGPFATLIELNDNTYLDWVGDVLAARKIDKRHLSRRRFKIYPDQLSGQYELIGHCAKYQNKEFGLLFAGPNWYLEKGQWQINFNGNSSSKTKISILQDQIKIKEFEIEGSPTSIQLNLSQDLDSFEILCLGTEIILDNIEFIKL